MKRTTIILCVAAATLSGCHIYKPYSRPEVDTEGLYGQDVEARDTASIASLPWTELFTDPTLQSLICEGLERNTFDGQEFPDRLAVGVPLQLLERRPDVRQAEAALAQAFYNTGAARSAFYPGVTLSGSAGWTNNSGAAIVNPGNWLLSAIGSLTQPLFNRGRNIANLRVAKARQEEALLSFRQSLLKAGNEVNDALAQWQTARERLDIDRRQVEALRRAADNTLRLMEHSDSATYLEVITARQSLLQAELTEANDRFDKIQGVINLFHALGGGAE